jgi:hypothetical protein
VEAQYQEAAMDHAHFDAWTRRRFGLVASSLGIAALAGTRPHDAAAKKRNKKKTKKKTCKGKTGGPVTCGDVCPAVGAFAFHLNGGGDVCATGADPHDCVE